MKKTMKRSHKLIIVSAAALAVALCAFLVFYLFFHGNGKIGDCNMDSTVNAFDSNYISRLISGKPVIISLKSSDLNSDKMHNDADRSLLRKFLSGNYFPGHRYEHIYLNGTDIKEYRIIIPENCTDFEKWTAEILAGSIEDLSGERIPVLSDKEKESSREILIGKTDRSESKNWTATNGQYLIFSRGTKIVLKGENYYVAGGAGHLISILEQSLVPWNSDAYIEIGGEIRSRSVLWEEPEKIFFFIGDGMGLNHTKMATDPNVRVEYANNYVNTPDEKTTDVFWPSTFKNIGDSVTLNIQNSTTDSAAGATALSTGYKTLNGALGMIPADLDGDGEENEFRSVQNVREAANLAGMATAVISTDKLTGATPNAFLVHHYTRKDRNILLEQQAALETVRLACNYVWCNYDSDEVFEGFRDAVDICDDNPGGFFIMTEEAMIDKYGEKMDYDNVIRTVKRLNELTAYAATYAMCYRDTLMVITADHETGGLTLSEDNVWSWTSNGEHTGTNVPVFAMGYGTEFFADTTRDNTEIAKFIFDAIDN